MIAVALSPKARALIRAHRDPHRPTAADRERVAAALRARLGATVLPLEASTGSRLMGIGMQRQFIAAFGLCVMSSALFLAERPAVEPARMGDKSVATAPSTPSVLVPNTDTPLPSRANTSSERAVTPRPEIAPIASQHARSKVAQTPATQDTLAQELVLLTSAARQLSAGQASGALLALEEHQRQFARGVLSTERNVAKARALCMLHRFDEGRAALARLATGTPSAARVREECDSAWARAHTADLRTML